MIAEVSMNAMTATAVADAPAAAPSSHQNLGEENSVWFQLTPLMKATGNPMLTLMTMGEL